MHFQVCVCVCKADQLISCYVVRYDLASHCELHWSIQIPRARAVKLLYPCVCVEGDAPDQYLHSNVALYVCVSVCAEDSLFDCTLKKVIRLDIMHFNGMRSEPLI